MNVQHHHPGSPAPDSHVTGRCSDLTWWRPPPVPAPALHQQPPHPPITRPPAHATSTVLTTNKYRSHDQQVPFSRRISTVLAVGCGPWTGGPRTPEGLAPVSRLPAPRRRPLRNRGPHDEGRSVACPVAAVVPGPARRRSQRAVSPSRTAPASAGGCSRAPVRSAPHGRLLIPRARPGSPCWQSGCTRTRLLSPAGAPWPGRPGCPRW